MLFRTVVSRVGLPALVSAAALVAGPLVGLSHAAVTVASTSPSNGTTTATPPNTISVTFSSTVVPGGSISVKKRGNPTNETCTQAQGNSTSTSTLSCTPGRLPDGTYDATWSTTEPGPPPAAATGTFSFTVDTTAPQLTSSSPIAGTTVKSPSAITVNFNEPLAGGSNGSTIRLLNATGNQVSPPGGSINGNSLVYVPAGTLNDGGPYTVLTHAVDTLGNAGDPQFIFYVDTTAPGQPSIISLPAYLNIANIAAVPVTGAAPVGESGTTVSLAFTDAPPTVVPITSTTFVTQNLSWAKTVSGLSALPEGPVRLSVTLSDAAGNVSAAVTRDAVKDTVAPAQPSIVLPTVDNGNAAATVINGTAEAGALVATTVTDGTRTVIAPNAVADAAGVWTTTVDLTSMAEGSISATSTQTDVAGNKGPARTVTAAKDTVDLALVSSSPADGGSANTVTSVVGTFNEQIADGFTAVLTDRNGDAIASTVTRSANKLQVVLTPASGLTEAGSPYDVAFDVSDNRTPTAEVLRTSIRFIVDKTAPVLPTISFSGPITATRSSATLVGAGEPGSRVTVLLTDGTSTPPKSSTVTVDSGGRYVASISGGGLAEGQISATAKAADAANNQSATSAPVYSVKDTVAPSAPGIASPAAVTKANVTSYSLSGTGESGAALRVSIDDSSASTPTVVVGPITVTGGAWSGSADLSSLADGPITIVAIQSDSVQNLSPTTTVETTKDVTQLVTFSGGLSPTPSSGETQTFTATAHQTSDPASAVDASFTGVLTKISSTDALQSVSCAAAVAGVASCTTTFGDLGTQSFVIGAGQVRGPGTVSVQATGLAFQSAPRPTAPNVEVSVTVRPTGVTGANPAGYAKPLRVYASSGSTPANGSLLSSCTGGPCTLTIRWSTGGSKSLRVSDGTLSTPTIQVLVATPTSLTSALSASTVNQKGSTTLSGTLRNAQTNVGIAGATVVIYRKVAPATSYSAIATLRTSSGGAYSYTATGLTRNTSFYARYGGSSTYLGRASVARAVLVAAGVSATFPSSITAGRALSVSGRTTPADGGARVSIVERLSNGSAVVIASSTVRPDGTFTVTRAAGLSRGTHTLRIVVSGSSLNGAGVTAYVPVKAV